MIDFLAAAVRIATPLLLAALGGILSERAGVFAVGLEGMMLMGAFAAALGAWTTDSSLVGIALALVGGASVALVVSIVTVRYRADDMVTGLTANILDKLSSSRAGTRSWRRSPASSIPLQRLTDRRRHSRRSAEPSEYGQRNQIGLHLHDIGTDGKAEALEPQLERLGSAECVAKFVDWV
jgi:ABC-type uncharacterized transport system permease subunit